MLVADRVLLGLAEGGGGGWDRGVNRSSVRGPSYSTC